MFSCEIRWNCIFSLFLSFCIDSIRLPFSGMINFPTQGRNMFYNPSEKELLTLGQASLTSLLASWTSWDFFLATCRAITPFSGYCLCTFCSIALFSFLLYICIYSYSSSTFLEELTCVIILFIFDHFGGTHVLTSYSGPLSKEKVRRQSHKSQGFYFVYRTQ